MEIRLVGRQWASPKPISHEWLAWCKPSVRHPIVMSPSSSVDVCPPSVVRLLEDVLGDGGGRKIHLGVEDLRHPCDDIFAKCYGYLGGGRQSLPISTPPYNKFVGGVLAGGPHDLPEPTRLRSIRAGRPAMANMLHVDEVVRFEGRVIIHTLEGRQTNTWCSTMRVQDVHREGQNDYAPGCIYSPPLPRRARIVYIDTRKLRWCSIGSAAFHSFAWPRKVKEAKGIARTLFIDHRNWADVLIVRGR